MTQPKPIKIENEGETIFVSDNVKDLDVESLVDPLVEEDKEPVKEEEEEEEDEILFAQAKLVCAFESDFFSSKSTNTIYEGFQGRLITHLIHNDEETLSFYISIEKALLLSDLHKHTPGSQKALIELSYVHHDEPIGLKEWKKKNNSFSLLCGVELTSFEKSKCIVTVKLRRTV